MYSIIEHQVEIAKAQKKLQQTIKKEFPIRLKRDIGWQSGRIEGAELFAKDKYWYWTSEHMEGAIPRNHNWFGVYGAGPGVSISVEINTAHDLSGRIAGFFARNSDTGVIYLFHSGGVAGGTVGVGKFNFLAWAGLTPSKVVDSTGKVRVGIPVMPVEGVACTRSAVNYIQRIVDYKRAAKQGETNSPEIINRVSQLEGYNKEATGRRTGMRRSLEIDYVSRHGEVVDALYRWRAKMGLRKGTSISNRGLIDLGVKRGGKLVEVYEVKSSVARQDVYTAIGQVTVHSPDADCRRILVLPNNQVLHSELEHALLRNSIALIRYELTEDDAVIL